MSFLEYLKERGYFLLINFMLFISIALIMSLVRIPNVIIFLIFIIWFSPLGIYIVFEYIKSNKYYGNLKILNEELDRKYLLPEIIEEPYFMEGKIVHEILREANKSMYENVREYKNKEEEYREYIETWVHEIKTPIASIRLILENNKNELTNKFSSEMDKIELFIEQTLYYSRSNDVSKDYVVKKFSLKNSLYKVIKRNSRDFISKRIALNIEEKNVEVYSDSKWVEFIVNQIIGNSVKYSKGENSSINISIEEEKEKTKLIIEDNGVGIDERDIKRVFEKGFTGENGRKYGKSTGMGLYLCKKLCEKLNIGIELESEVGRGTRVILIFPQGSMTSFS